MENLVTFEDLVQQNCFGVNDEVKRAAAQQLEWRYGCEIFVQEMDASVKFAHHARGCTIVATKLCRGVVIYQNVTIGSNLKYNKRRQQWENLGTPILAENVVVADGAKILGPIIIGANTLVAAGAIITQDIPANSIAYDVNQYKPKSADYELVYYEPMPQREQLIQANQDLLRQFETE